MQQPLGWLRHTCICFALMSKSLPNFAWPDFYFQVFKNICQSLRNTHGNMGIIAGFSLVKNAAGELETARSPFHVPTDAAAKPCCFIHLLGCFFFVFFCQIISLLKFNFYFVQRCTSVTVAQFHGLNDRALILLEQEGADTVWIDRTWQIVAFLITIFIWASISHGWPLPPQPTCCILVIKYLCGWCWNKSPLVENEMEFFFTALQFLMNMRSVLETNQEHVLH